MEKQAKTAKKLMKYKEKIYCRILSAAEWKKAKNITTFGKKKPNNKSI